MSKRKLTQAVRSFQNCIMTKYREPIMYLIFGFLATAISVIVFFVLVDFAQIEAVYANIVSWIAAVTFAFFTNRNFVFQSSKQKEVRLFVSFFTGRIATLILEELILIVFMLFYDNVKVIKIIGQIAVIIANYLISKWIVFKKK